MQAACVNEQEVAAPVKRGDAQLARPLVLRASSKSSGSSLRRALRFGFDPEALPYGLALMSADRTDGSRP